MADTTRTTRLSDGTIVDYWGSGTTEIRRDGKVVFISNKLRAEFLEAISAQEITRPQSLAEVKGDDEQH